MSYLFCTFFWADKQVFEAMLIDEIDFFDMVTLVRFKSKVVNKTTTNNMCHETINIILFSQL